MSRIANPFSIGLNDPTSSSGKPGKSNFDHAVDRLDNSRADVKNNIDDYVNGLGITYLMLHG